MLEVAVDDRSLRDARDRIESELGSVRATVESGGGSTAAPSALTDGGDGVRGLLETQTEQLEEIREGIEDIRTDSGGGGGGGLLGAGLLARTIGGVGLGTAGLAAGGVGAGIAADRLTRNKLPEGARSTLRQSQNFRQTPIGSQITNPVEFGQTVGEVLTAEVQSRLQGVSVAPPDWLSELTSLSFETPSWLSDLTSVSFDTPSWLSTLANPSITAPTWLSDLTNPQITAPSWVQDLQSLLGGGGEDTPATTRPDTFPGSDQRLFNEATRRRDSGGGTTEVNNDITVEAVIDDLSSAQRTIERTVEDALRNDLLGGL